MKVPLFKVPKKVIPIVLLCLLAFPGVVIAEANSWLNSGSNMYSNVSGNVGVGTGAGITPATKLHVYGTSDAGLGGGGLLTLGVMTGLNLVLDGNEIIARSNGSAAPLYIQGSSTTGDTILNQTDGQVGIGITDPAEKLDVNGNIRLTGDLNFNNDDLINYNEGTNTWGFYSDKNQSANPRLVISESSVGIGTSTPSSSYKLDIAGAERLSDTLTLTGTSTNIINATGLGVQTVALSNDGITGVDKITIEDKGDNEGIDWQDGKNISVYDATDAGCSYNAFQFNTTNTYPYYFNGGNVGIGTHTPDVKLHIEEGSDATLGSGGYLILGPSTGQNIVLDENEIFARYNGDYDDLFLQASGSTKDTYINPTGGKVGIGEVNPANLTSKLNVNGDIRAKSVTVENTNWSDFVFEDGYNLRSLDEVNQYINDNNHLPDIPSALEVGNNGVNLGEMDAKLLQKIEELTLYMIDLKEENEELKTRLDSLESK